MELTPHTRGAIFSQMINIKFPAILFSFFLVATAIGCSGFLPDRLVYPNNMPDPKQRTKKANEEVKPAAEQAPPAKAVAQPESVSATNEKDTVLFGEAPSGAGAQPAAVKKATTKSWDESNAPPPRDINGKAPAAAAVVAQPSELAPNALTRTFDVEYPKGWDKTLEAMFVLPVMSVDKASGVIITDWIVDKPAYDGGLNLFGSGVRSVRYKYLVKVYDRGGKTEVSVASQAQYSGSGGWISGTPKVIVSERLMKRIVEAIGN